MLKVLEVLDMHGLRGDPEKFFILLVGLKLARVAGTLDFRDQRRGHLLIKKTLCLVWEMSIMQIKWYGDY